MNSFLNPVCSGGKTAVPGMKLSLHNRIGLVGLLFFCLFARSAQANVYATDIRLNGSLLPQVILPGGNLTISYILNETATVGVWVRLYYGTNVVKTRASADGNAARNRMLADFARALNELLLDLALQASAKRTAWCGMATGNHAGKTERNTCRPSEKISLST